MPAAATAPILRRHVVLVFVDRLDMAAARAIQYARTLTPDELRAVHFAVDDRGRRTSWPTSGAGSGLPRVPLEHRRVPRPPPHPGRGASTSPASWPTARPRCSVLLPDRQVPRALAPASCTTARRRRSSSELSRLPHANVTTVPFQFDGAVP